MVKLYIKPADVHSLFWERAVRTGYTQGLSISELQRQEATVQLLHVALENIFLSIEEVPGCQLPDILEPYVLQESLHRLLQARGLLEEPERVSGTARIVTETEFGTDYLDRRTVERIVYASNRELVDIAFGEVLNAFIEEIEEMIRAGCTQIGKKFNQYAIVTVTPRIGVGAKILCLEIELGEDIRHVYFAKAFPTGRYSSDDHDKIRDMQSLLPHIA